LGKYREKIDIIADILQIVSRRTRKTQIMYQANLSHAILQKYVASMLQSALMSFQPESKSYLITDKGSKFIQTYKEYCKCNKAVEKQLSQMDDRKSYLMEFCQDV
jgi:predicted transcriptional regulator